MRATKIVGIIGLLFLAYVVLTPFLIHDYVFGYALPSGEQTPLTALLGLTYIFSVWGALIAACIFLIAWGGRGFAAAERVRAHEGTEKVVEFPSGRPAQLERSAS